MKLQVNKTISSPYPLPTPITDDDMSVQTTDTDDSLPHSISLPLIEEPESGLETSETSGK